MIGLAKQLNQMSLCQPLILPLSSPWYMLLIAVTLAQETTSHPSQFRLAVLVQLIV